MGSTFSLSVGKSVYHYFRFWRLDRTSERLHSALLRRVRVRRLNKRAPSLALRGVNKRK
jgi:hypothetical protein